MPVALKSREGKTLEEPQPTLTKDRLRRITQKDPPWKPSTSIWTKIGRAEENGGLRKGRRDI